MDSETTVNLLVFNKWAREKLNELKSDTDVDSIKGKIDDMWVDLYKDNMKTYLAQNKEACDNFFKVYETMLEPKFDKIAFIDFQINRMSYTKKIKPIVNRQEVQGPADFSDIQEFFKRYQSHKPTLPGSPISAYSSSPLASLSSDSPNAGSLDGTSSSPSTSSPPPLVFRSSDSPSYGSSEKTPFIHEVTPESGDAWEKFKNGILNEDKYNSSTALDKLLNLQKRLLGLKDKMPTTFLENTSIDNKMENRKVWELSNKQLVKLITDLKDLLRESPGLLKDDEAIFTFKKMRPHIRDYLNLMKKNPIGQHFRQPDQLNVFLQRFDEMTQPKSSNYFNWRFPYRNKSLSKSKEYELSNLHIHIKVKNDWSLIKENTDKLLEASKKENWEDLELWEKRVVALKNLINHYETFFKSYKDYLSKFTGKDEFSKEVKDYLNKLDEIKAPLKYVPHSYTIEPELESRIDNLPNLLKPQAPRTWRRFFTWGSGRSHRRDRRRKRRHGKTYKRHRHCKTRRNRH